ncbi:MAG: hypothetical protein RL693_2821 [Verrucomicrobiota bacterium]
MEPFSHDDPLYKLLGKARSVEPRPNFTQNVLRAIRQEPPATSAWLKIKAWIALRPLYIGATAALLLTGLALFTWNTESPNALPVLAHTETAPGNSAITSPLSTEEPVAITDTTVASELGNMDQLSTLLAQEDTRSFSDGEIALLLY